MQVSLGKLTLKKRIPVVFALSLGIVSLGFWMLEPAGAEMPVGILLMLASCFTALKLFGDAMRAEE